MPTRSRHCKRGAVAPVRRDDSFRPHTSLHPSGCGKARAAATIRKSGHMGTGTSLFPAPHSAGSGAIDAGGGSMKICLRFPVLVFLISTLFVGHAFPQTPPISINETVVVTATGKEEPVSQVG